MGTEELTVLIEEFSLQMQKFSFDKAREFVEDQRVKLQTVGSCEPAIATLLGCLAQLSLAEKSYLNFVFLHPKGFLKKEGALKTNFNAIRSDLNKLTTEASEKSADSTKETLEAHISKQLHRYVCARIDLMNFYEKLSLMANSKGSFLGTQAITSLIEEVYEKYRDCLQHPSLTLFFENFTNECEILIHLLKASSAIVNFQFFPSLEHLHQSRCRLDCWTGQFEDRQDQKSGWFGFRSTPNTQLPILTTWIRRFHECLMGKFTLYFYESLSKQVPVAEMKTQLSRVSCNYIQRITNFHRRNDPVVVAFIVNSQDLEGFRGFGHFFSGKPADTLRGLESYPVMFAMPSDRIAGHMPAIVMMINEFAHKSLPAADRLDFVFDAQHQLSYFLCNVELSVFIAVVFASRKGEKDSNVLTFLQEISADLRLSKTFGNLRMASK